MAHPTGAEHHHPSGAPAPRASTTLPRAGAGASRLPSNVLELLHPGSFVRLHNQPSDLPPFQLIHCRGGRCWVRQQTWGPMVHWEVEHRQLTAD